MSRRAAFSVGVFLILVAAAAACLLLPAAQWRTKLLWLKVSGGAEAMAWSDTWRLVSPRSGYHLPRLAETGNPFDSIRNPFGSAGDSQAGGERFRTTCANCHGATAGGGAVGPALDVPTLRHGDSDWAIHRNILRGIAGTRMEAQPVSDHEAWQLLAYIRSRQQANQAAGTTPDAVAASMVDAVSDERLLNARGRPRDWLMYSGAYDGRRFSDLSQIQPGNVHQIQLKWQRQVEVGDGLFEVTPIVNGELMFVTEPPGRVLALSVATGREVWKYDRPIPEAMPLCCGRVNRGVAVHEDRVFVGTLDGYLVALDANSGRLLWSAVVGDYQRGLSITSAPLAVKGLVIVGVSGGEYGVRGYIDAYEARTGQRRWRFYTIPGPGEPGHDSWSGNSWQTGGGAAWMTGSFDPELNLLYWGTGNPSPNYHGDSRQGDNLHTCSLVALDLESGKLRWHFQFTPHDVRDWDSNQVPVLADVDEAGTRRPVVMTANRNGFFYVLDRRTGEFLRAEPYVRQNWAKTAGPGARPVADPAMLPTPAGIVSWPSIFGGTNWQSPTYDSVNGLFSVPFVEGGRIILKQPDTPIHRPGQPFWGGSHETISRVQTLFTGVRAIDPLTGKVRWEYRNKPRRDGWATGGLLSTKGGIVFGGDDTDVFALDAADGSELWRLPVGGKINASPMTYAVDGEQRITIAAGRTLLTFGLPAPATRKSGT